MRPGTALVQNLKFPPALAGGRWGAGVKAQAQGCLDQPGPAVPRFGRGYRKGDITTHCSAPELEELVQAANEVCEEKSGKRPALVVVKQKAVTA